jgi:diphthamide biosynthesis protein 3
MAENIYDEIEIEDMTYDPVLQIYHYPCPCGDRFEIGIADLRDGEDIGVCPSCSLMIRVIFEVVSQPCILVEFGRNDRWGWIERHSIGRHRPFPTNFC